MPAVSSRAAALCLLGLLSAAPSRTASSVVSITSTPIVSPAPGARGPVRVPLEDGVAVLLSDDKGITVEAAPRRGEGIGAFATRLCGDAGAASKVAEVNGATTLQATARYSIPFDLLSPEWQLKAARALFEDDRGEADGWRHKVRGTGPLQRESLWSLAEWFTGTGENFRAIREYNELMDDDVSRGTAVSIPSELLRPAFRAALPVPEKPYLLQYGIGQGRRVRRLPPAPARGALLLGGGALHRPRLRGGRQRPRRADRQAQRHPGRHRHPDRLPDQDPVRRPAARVPARGASEAQGVRGEPAPERPLQQPGQGQGARRHHHRARRRPWRPGRRGDPGRRLGKPLRLRRRDADQEAAGDADGRPGAGHHARRRATSGSRTPTSSPSRAATRC